MSLHERGRSKLYFLFMLLLELAMLGVFMAQDLFLFYIFWEVTLVPMYFLIGIWGAEQRVYAAVKFFLYTMAGSILMLLAILYVGSAAGTFSVPDIIAAVQSGALVFPFDGLLSTQGLLFLGFLIAFAIKVPIWPLHSWLPDAHVQAPTAGSVILAGVMLKLGYVWYRPLLPADVPAGERSVGTDYRRAGGDRHHLRRVGQLRADRREEAGRLFVGEPPRFRRPRHLRADGGGHSGRHPANGQSRHQHGRLVPRRRDALRTPPHQSDGRLRRHLEGAAAVRRAER